MSGKLKIYSIDTFELGCTFLYCRIKFNREDLTEKKFSLISDYDQVGPCIDEIIAHLSSQGIEQFTCNAVTISLTEAINNVIKHSYKGEPNHLIEVKVSKIDNLLNIVIVDTGSPRPNLDVRELDFDPSDIDNLPEGGMGLFIIKQLMDEMSYYTINGENYFALKKWLY